LDVNRLIEGYRWHWVCGVVKREYSEFVKKLDLPHLLLLNCNREAELFLSLNNFSFNSSHFLQKKGVAMGTHMGPSYACLFMGYVEHSLFHQSYSGLLPQLLYRYIDDYFGATSYSHLDLEKFINFDSNSHPSITLHMVHL